MEKQNIYPDSFQIDLYKYITENRFYKSGDLMLADPASAGAIDYIVNCLKLYSKEKNLKTYLEGCVKEDKTASNYGLFLCYQILFGPLEDVPLHISSVGYDILCSFRLKYGKKGLRNNSQSF